MTDDDELRRVFSTEYERVFDGKWQNGSAAMVAALRAVFEAGARAQQSADAEDARKYRLLCDMECNHFHLTLNDDPATNYVSARTWIEEYSPDEFAEVPAAELQAMKDMNTIWTLQIYPNTPVGFNVYRAATLGGVINAAFGDGKKEAS